MKKIITVLLTALLLTSGAVWAEEETVNIAPQSSVTVSSTYGYAGYEADKAVDDSDDTVWWNGFYPNAEQFYQIDFSHPMNISQLSLLMYPAGGYNDDFEIRLIKDGGYDVLYTCGAGEAATERLEFAAEEINQSVKYLGVTVIKHTIGTTLGICDLKVFVPKDQADGGEPVVPDGLVNVSKGKKVTGGENAFKIPPEDLVDGNLASFGVTQGSTIDIDLGRRYSISRIELYTINYEANGGFKSGYQIYASNTPGFTDPDDVVLLKQYDEELTSTTSYSFEVDGSEYRFIRFAGTTGDFRGLAELSVFAETDENFGRWTLSDSANEITVLEGKTPASIQIPVTNNTGDAKSYTLIALVTGPDGKVLSSAAKTQSITGEDTITAELSGYSEALPAGCRIKAILVDNYIGMNQLCGGFEIDERGMAQ